MTNIFVHHMYIYIHIHIHTHTHVQLHTCLLMMFVDYVIFLTYKVLFLYIHIYIFQCTSFLSPLLQQITIPSLDDPLQSLTCYMMLNFWCLILRGNAPIITAAKTKTELLQWKCKMKTNTRESRACVA